MGDTKHRGVIIISFVNNWESFPLYCACDASPIHDFYVGDYVKCQENGYEIWGIGREKAIAQKKPPVMVSYNKAVRLATISLLKQDKI